MLQKELLVIQTIIYLNKVLSAGYNPCNRVEYNCNTEWQIISVQKWFQCCLLGRVSYETA